MDKDKNYDPLLPNEKRAELDKTGPGDGIPETPADEGEVGLGGEEYYPKNEARQEFQSEKNAVYDKD